MNCKLCHIDKPLIKKSHIIPDFMYQGLFNEKHFIAPVYLKEMKVGKMKPTGFYDSDILCADCERKIIGKLESYAKLVLWGGKGNPNKFQKLISANTHEGNNLLYFENIEYTKFKLFLLSILWRASISKQKIFNQVNLGEHEEVIRKMIIENDSKTENDYSVGIMLLKENKITPTKFIVDPIKIEEFETLTYVFIVNGIVIDYNISGNAFNNIFDAIKIKENNTMNILLFSDKESIEYVDSILKQKLRYK